MPVCSDQRSVTTHGSMCATGRILNIYTKFFGLETAPFDMTPDPAFLYMTAQHREALAGITYALSARKGFVVLLGDAGTGKTTVLTGALRYFSNEKLNSSVILNPLLTSAEFLEMVLLDFGVKDVPPTKPQRLLKLLDMLEADHRAGKISTLVVDEAHLLSTELLEEIRLLGNLERADEKLLQIVLAGQLPLTAMLNRRELAQLKQRTAVRINIKPLEKKEDVEGYLKFRWIRAGGKTPPFTSAAIEELTRRSSGLPRVMNSICDTALMLAFAEELQCVSEQHIRKACIDLDITETPLRYDAEPSSLSAPKGSGRNPDPVLSSNSNEVTTNKQLDVEPEPLVTHLDRYTDPSKRPFLMRCAVKLGLVG